MSIYTITVLKLDSNGRTKRLRPWGYFEDQATAEKCILENWTDIFEHDYYDHAVIEEIGPGIIGHYKKLNWYKIDYIELSSGKYEEHIYKIDEPISKKHYVRFFFGASSDNVEIQQLKKEIKELEQQLHEAKRK